MTSSIIDFLEARLAEDEKAANAATNYCGSSWYAHGGQVLNDEMGVIATGPQEDLDDEAVHIALHDPARVLREVQAKRAILDEHSTFTSVWWPDVEAVEVECCRTCSGGEHEPDAAVEQPCPTLRDLAAPYSDHPDYNPEWSTN